MSPDAAPTFLIMNNYNDIAPFNRGDNSIKNVLRMLKPILEEKELIGTVVKCADLAKLCRNHHRRLPVRSYRALDLADDISGIVRGGGSFLFDGLVITVYMDSDLATGRRSPSIEFQRDVSLEQECLDSQPHETQEVGQ